ncbi:MAG: hypothetical protein WAM04_15855 [Candidatus Sulfotelmatobacter sp.]
MSLEQVVRHEHGVAWDRIDWLMTKLDKLASEPRPHAPHSDAQQPRWWLSRHWDLLVLLFFLLASIDPVWFSPRALSLVHDASLADDSWHLDEVFKLTRGIWVGRDVAFTHGPLFQWLSSVPTGFVGISVGAIFATWNAVPVWCAFVFIFLTLRLLLAEQPAWKRALLLFLLLEFWLVSWEWLLQNAFPAFLFAIFARGWYAVTEGRVKSYAFGIAAALLCVIAFLFASDCGAYSVAAWVIATAAVFFEERRNKQAVGRCMAALLAYAVSGLGLALVVNEVMGGAFDFRFWKDSAEIVSAYRWATPTAMTRAGTVRLLGTLFGGAAVFLVRALTASKQKSAARSSAMTERTGFLLGGFAYALVTMQSALVRSDYGHLENGCFAMVLLAGVILFSFQSTGASYAAALVAIACSMVPSQRAFGPGTITRLVREWRQPMTECPANLSAFDRGCFVPEFSTMLQSAASYLSQHSGPQERIVVFPYQTMFGLASRRSVAGGLMQGYTASGTYLSELEVAGLESAAAPSGVYVNDLEWSVQRGRAELTESDRVRWHNLGMSRPIDGVYNFTRTPEVWLWLVRHYRLEGGALSEGIFGLRRDDSRDSRISMQAESLGVAAQTFPIRERSSVADLGKVEWPADADFLRLRLKVRYAFWWKLRKPEAIRVEITRADGSSELRWFVAQPNVSSEIWIYPGSPGDQVHYFDADESQWRNTPGTMPRTVPRPTITRLRIVAAPLDWVSATPAAIVLEAADAVRIHLRP